MKLRKLTINNFRGIRELEWELHGNIACLVGTGDSRKSTILLALEYLFWNTWNLAISEVDFYQRKTDTPIKISAIVTDLPKKIADEDKFGLHLGFYDPDNKTFHKDDSTQDKRVKALHICLTIESNFEPTWEVIPFQLQEQRDTQKINATERRLLGILRIGNYTEADLTWGRNSAMSRMTENIDQIPDMLASLERDILNAIGNADLSTLNQTVRNFEQGCQALGVDSGNKVQAGIDPSRMSLRQGAVALLDENLPLTLRGAGSRRLMSMAANKTSIKDGAVILIDEIENSLEPYRLRHLIRQIRPNKDETHQVIFSTHSAVSVVECKSDELYVVRNENGKIFVVQVGTELQDIARKVPEAFLAKRTIVCEGKTEEGFLIGLDKEYWEPKRLINKKKYQNMAEAGAMPVLGGGDESPKIAVALANLGYQVAFFGDSDKVDKLIPSIAEMELNAINVILWDMNENIGVSIEERLCFDLPLEALSEVVKLAIKIKVEDNSSEQEVWNEIYRHITISPQDKNFQSLQSMVSESDLRQKLGKAACKGGWFKRRDKGEHLAKLVTRYLNQMELTPTMKTLKQLEAWCYE